MATSPSAVGVSALLYKEILTDDSVVFAPIEAPNVDFILVQKVLNPWSLKKDIIFFSYSVFINESGISVLGLDNNSSVKDVIASIGC